VVAATAPKGVAPLFVLFALAAIGLFRRATGGWPQPDRAVAAILAAIALFGAASLGWTAGLPADAVTWIVQTAPVFGLGVLLVPTARPIDETGRRRIGLALLAGCLLALALYILERKLLDRQVQPGLVAAALVLWPGLAVLPALPRPRLIGLGLIGAVLTISVMFGSLAAVVALLFGGAVAVLAQFAPRLTPAALGAAFVAWTLVAPVAATHLPDPETAANNVPMIANSTLHRLAIYRGVGDLIVQAPILGHGANSARGIPEGQNRIDYDFAVGEKIYVAHTELIPLHPHNAVLQVWLELGLVGALLTCALIVVVLRAIVATTEGSGRVLALAAFAAVFAVQNVSFGAWQSWWLCLMLILATLGQATLARREQPQGLGPSATSVKKQA
jgi:O-antigen ligase